MSLLRPSFAACAVLGSLVALANAQQNTPATQAQPRQPAVRQAQPGQPAQPGRAVRPVAPGAAAQAQGSQALDHMLVHCLRLGNQAEIEVAKFVQDKSESKEVQEFAEMMVKDHTDFLNALNKVAGAERGQRDEGAPRAQDNNAAQPRPGAAAQAQPQTRPQPGAQPRAQAWAGGKGGLGMQMAQIQEEIHDRCVASLKAKLDEKEGADFNKCYIGQQIVAHMQMLDMLKVYEKHASPELAQVINNGIQTTGDHLQHAERMMKDLEGAAASTVRRPSNQEAK